MPGARRPLDFDDYLGLKAGPVARLERDAAVAWVRRGSTLTPDVAVRWGARPCAELDGLAMLEERAGAADPFPPGGLLVGTVRMGYGHYRMALGVCSWALERQSTPWLLDLLATARDESRIIGRSDALYSRLSRAAADLGGVAEWTWGRMMKSGGIATLRASCELAEQLTGLLDGLPRDAPVVSTYPLFGQAAVACGFEQVVNLVFDNDPQYFLLVPRALNVVQSPSAYQRLRQLGVPARDLAIAGHWVGADIARNAARDSELRIRRAERSAPRRLLVSVGGAGAQRRYLTELFTALAPRLAGGELRLLVNIGDHRALEQPFREHFEQLKLATDHVADWEALHDFVRANDLGAPERERAPVTLFSFKRHLEAVLATDQLVRVSDVLVTKPSELAFVPVPKLHIRRVGDHEARSARRSAELGDGTLECRTVADAVRMVTMMTEDASLVRAMNEFIIGNAARGTYDGSRRAVEYALDGAPRR